MNIFNVKLKIPVCKVCGFNASGYHQRSKSK